jgi:hypothetical protein
MWMIVNSLNSMLQVFLEHVDLYHAVDNPVYMDFFEEK